jgi:hypothetical protein
MNALGPVLGLNPGSTALTRALGDPRIVGIAQSMNLNLQDPRVLKGLLKRTRQIIEASAEVTIGSELLPAEPATVTDAYARNAIRTYRQIERMR